MKQENIRLEPSEIAALSRNFRRCFAPGDHLWIFGSRVNPKARGGDIDLYVETTLLEASEVIEKQNAFLYALYEEIGLRKIDVVLNVVKNDTHLPIYAVAKEEGVPKFIVSSQRRNICQRSVVLGV